jgi:Flp pilus assembly protein TadG
MVGKFQRGNAIIEFLLCLPLLLLVVTGLLNLGSILWQVQLFTDAVRYGARFAATRSNFEDVCSTLTGNGQIETANYMRAQAPGAAAASSWWTLPASQIRRDVSWDADVAVDFVDVTIETNGSDNCLLCINNILDYIPVNLRGTFVVEDPCL